MSRDLIGTVIEEDTKEDEKKKFVPEWQQKVTDEQGRRRFHGAFTGGFSAGYYNTVGSAEGWAPKQFVSSRKKRAAQTKDMAGAVQQKPSDFMDEEDLEQFGLVEGLVAREGFDILVKKKIFFS